MSVRARTWSPVVNFQDSKGQQVSKSAHHSRQTSCLHGLWFGLVHQPPAWDSDDHAYISSIGSAREQLGDGLCPMHDQKLVREYLRHGAEWTAYVHCQAISRASLMTTDRDITYLRARYSHSVLPDDPDVDDPYFIFIINEFGIGQGWRFRTDMHSAFTFHALPEATSSSASLTGLRQSHKTGKLALLCYEKLEAGPVICPTNFHGCPHGLAMASSYEELLTKGCAVNMELRQCCLLTLLHIILGQVFPRRCNLPRWTSTSSSTEHFPMPPSTHVVWRNSVRYSSTHYLLMSIRPFLGNSLCVALRVESLDLRNYALMLTTLQFCVAIVLRLRLTC